MHKLMVGLIDELWCIVYVGRVSSYIAFSATHGPLLDTLNPKP